jgi:acyl carrier protein
MESAASAPLDRAAIEQTLMAVLRDVLGENTQIGADDNFFELGADSKIAAEVHSRMQQLLGRELTQVDLFTYPTVAKLSAYLAGETSEARADSAADRARKRQQMMNRRRGG